MTSKRYQIMVVDDSQSMRAAAVSALGEAYEVMTCEDGMDAIARVASFRPDLVFMDIAMPRLDGYESVALMRMNDAFRDVPVIMMSSKGGAFDIAKGALLGFDGHIIKPFESKEMLGIAQRFLHPSNAINPHG
ncbi:MAG: response regulator [Polaromonas sp.]|nr:response regulator [Polaromonas sp.]